MTAPATTTSKKSKRSVPKTGRKSKGSSPGRSSDGSEPSDEEPSDSETDDPHPAYPKRAVHPHATLSSTHSLLRSLAQHTPLTLLSTLPLLESELDNTDVPHRLEAVETLGVLFGHPVKGGEVVAKASKVWKAWLGRNRDPEWKVRKIWVDRVGGMLGVAGGGGGGVDVKSALEPHLKMKLTDGDDRVRESTCRIFGRMDYETVLHHVQTETLKDLSLRVRDKKVRLDAPLFCLFFSQI